MSRIAIRSLFPASRASSLHRVWPAQLRLTGARPPAAGALGAAVIALTVVAAVTLGVPAAPAWATTSCSGGGSFTISSDVVSAGSSCTGAVTIPKSVTSINDFAFFGSPGLTSVTFEKDSALQTIGINAFRGSGLTSIEIPKLVTPIGADAFFDNSALTSVTFEKDSALQTIGIDAFRGSGLTSIEIPKSVTSIGVRAFSGTSTLTSVTFEGNAPSSVGSNVFNASWRRTGVRDPRGPEILF